MGRHKHRGTPIIKLYKMKKLLFLLALIGTIGAANAQNFDSNGFASLDSQWELTGGLLSVAASDGYDTVQAFGSQISIAYDFFEGGFKLAPEADVNFLFAGGATAVGFIPGVQVGHDNIYALVSYNITGSTPYYGLGGRIDLGDTSAISVGIQGGNINGIGVGYGNVGYTFRF